MLNTYGSDSTTYSDTWQEGSVETIWTCKQAAGNAPSSCTSFQITLIGDQTPPTLHMHSTVHLPSTMLLLKRHDSRAVLSTVVPAGGKASVVQLHCLCRF